MFLWGQKCVHTVTSWGPVAEWGQKQSGPHEEKEFKCIRGAPLNVTMKSPPTPHVEAPQPAVCVCMCVWVCNMTTLFK